MDNMLRDLIRGKDGFFALDIGVTAIRVLEAERSKGVVKFSKFGFSAIDPNLGDITAATGRQYLAEIIKDTVKQNGIKPRNVVIGVPSSAVMQRIIESKCQSDVDLRKLLREQLAKREPKDGKMNFDYHIIGPSPDNEEKNQVLIAAISRKFIKELTEMLESVGLNLIAVEPGSVAVIRAIANEGNSSFELIVNVKDFSTDLIIAKGGVPYMVQTVMFGAGLFVGVLQQNMKIDTPTAQSYIADYGLNPEIMNGQIVAAANAAIQQFVDAIFKSGNMFSRKSPNEPVSKIVMAGYGASIPGFSEIIYERIGLPVEPADPWQNMVITDKEKAELATVAPHFMAAIGLAERNGDDSA